jgi:hypothetical protein
LKKLLKAVHGSGSPERQDFDAAVLCGDLLPSGGFHWLAYRGRLEARRLEW